MQYMEKALAELDEQIATLQQTRTHMAAALGRPTTSFASYTTRSPAPGGRGVARRPMSEEAKQKIRDAQARRWASKKTEGTQPEKGEIPVVVSPAQLEEPKVAAGSPAEVVQPVPSEVEGHKEVATTAKKKEEIKKSAAKK